MILVQKPREMLFTFLEVFVGARGHMKGSRVFLQTIYLLWVLLHGVAVDLIGEDMAGLVLFAIPTLFKWLAFLNKELNDCHGCTKRHTVHIDPNTTSLRLRLFVLSQTTMPSLASLMFAVVKLLFDCLPMMSLHIVG